MTVFRPCTMNEYAAWLRAWLKAGNQPTHYYDYPFEGQTWLTAQQDFTTGGECGANAVCVVVPAGVSYKGGSLGHNQMYFMDGVTQRGGWIPVFNDPVFATLAEDIPAFIARKKAEDRAIERDMERRRVQADEAMRRSDVGRWRLGVCG